MGTGERTRARVEELLTDLEGLYGSFPVNQTTVALSDERYARARERAGEGDSIATYIELRNENDEILHVRRNGRVGLPGTIGDPEDALEDTVRQAVEAQTGVSVSIDGIAEATITGLRNAGDREAPIIYRLRVVFAGARTGGTPTEGAEWRPSRAALTPAIG